MSKLIVIVEDQHDIGELMKIKLENAGFLVLWRQNGRAAWETILSHKPDLAILDIMVPGMNGIELLGMIKADPRTRHIPVIMATAKGEQKDVVRAVRGGAVDYLVKPFLPAELLERVQRVLPEGEPAPAQDKPPPS